MMTTTMGQWVMERWARWQLPVLVLLGLLHRAPVWQVAAGIGPRLVGPTVAVVRSAFTLAAMGTYQTLAGATQLSASPESPLQTKVGETVAAGFAVTGAPASAGSYEVRGTLPPGVTIAGLRGDLVNASAVALTGTPTAAGTYELQITAWQGSNKNGFGGSPTFTYQIVVAAADAPPPPPPPPPVALTIQAQPASATVAPGGSVTFNVGATGASGAGELTYQWRRNGVAISGATAASFTLSVLTAAANADYTVAVTDANGTTVSAPATLLVATPQPGRLINLAVRSRAGSGDKTLIAGFTTTGGSGVGGLRLRALGPKLAEFGVPGVLANPLLQVFQGDTVVQSNDNVAAVEAVSFGLTAGALDSAMVLSLPANAYTAQVTGVGGGEGVALIEVNDAAPNVNDPGVPRLFNVAARTEVGTGADILIAGFTINGNVPKRLLIRALGPKLTEFGVGGVLANPRLQVFRGDTVVAENDDVSATDTAASGLTVGARDAALVVVLVPGAYTAQVSGVGDTTGVALIELTELE